MQAKQFKREDFAYQSAYCEENIWHLCQQEGFKNSYAVFIFSKGDSFPMLNQRASQHPTLPIFWDYHVVLLVMNEDNQIFDFDTTLPFNTNIETYFNQSFIDERLLSEIERPLFRLVPSSEFSKLFSSDRSHMKTTSGWLATPPSWPCIGNSTANLSEFIQPSNNRFGKLLSYHEIINRFS
jgi:hypothetical protein